MKNQIKLIGIIAIAAFIGFALTTCKNPSKDAYTPSEVKMPSATPSAGTYASAQTVTLTSATDGASIFYTLNGTEPTAASTLYSASITVSQTTTLKAIAIKSGMNSSPVFTAVYTIDLPVGTIATPMATPPAGTYTTVQNVILTSATEGASIYYTLNGAEPTAASTLYSGAITISATTTLKAIAVKSGMTDSSVLTASYTINLSPIPTPTANPAGGTYTSAQNVTLASATEGASIYYTLNGAEPTAASTLYSGAITISATTTLKAIAVKSGMPNSAVMIASYTINLSAADGWIGSVTTNGLSAPVYGFVLPSGDTFANYDRITVKIKTDAETSGRLRAFGAYAKSSFTFPITQENAPDMGNAADDKLLTEPGVDNFSQNGTWQSYSVTLATAAKTAQASSSGLLIVAVGIVPPQGNNSGSRTYYIKDIVLTNAAGTKAVAALNPDDAQLWGATGAGAFVTASYARNTATQTVLPYEEDSPPAAAVIDLTAEKQIIRGFGGINHPIWAGDLTVAQRNTAFGNGDNQLGFTVLRIWVSDKSSEWNREVATAKNAYDRGHLIFASPWNPPEAMRETFYRDADNPTARRLKANSYAAYAAHLNDFVTYMRNQGVELYAISIQNEPDYAHDWTWWTPAEIVDFLINHAGSINCRIIAPESFSYLKNLSDPILNNPQALANVDIFGTHLYGTRYNDFPYPLFREKGAGKELWMTEVYHPNSDENSADRWPEALEVARHVHSAMADAEFQAYVWWYIRRQYSPMKEDGTISKRGYMMAHFSKFVRPGYVRVDAVKNPNPNVYVSAYKGDNKVVIVAVNMDESSVDQPFVINASIGKVERWVTSSNQNLAKSPDINVTNGSFTAELAAQSVTTFVGSW